jgi:ATP-dependent helicase/nuclease subunit A
MTACRADGGEHLRMRVVDFDEREEQSEPGRPAVPADRAAAAELERRLSFRYPNKAAEELPSKLTATELKGRAEADGDAAELVPELAYSFRMPELDAGERPLRAAERGVATHLFLQYMDFARGRSRAGIRGELQRLCEARFLTERECEAVNVSAVERLFASPLGAEMLAAKELLREFRFSLLLDAHCLCPEAAGEELLLQGVVDCCLIEPDGLVIIDYKTDRVKTDEEIAARAAHYRGQLKAYSEALRRTLGKPVKRCVLFFLGPGKTVEVET